MRNLKRALSLTLASVMLLGMMIVGTSAVSFNDADDITNVTAATILQDLEIMVGDGENFMPNQVVTRGQMAIIVCKILYGDKLNVSQFSDATQYTDVAVGDYFNGYVNLATSLGIISGYGNGQFGPGDPVTTAQAALMLTKALGYFKGGELKGDWAVDSLAAITKATDLKMFADMKAPASNEGLTRDNVANMVFNTITKAVTVEYNANFDIYFNTGAAWANGVIFRYDDTLGFQRFDLVYKTKADGLGRPQTRWGVGSVNKTSGYLDNYGNLVSSQVIIADRDAIVDVNNTPLATYNTKLVTDANYDGDFKYTGGATSTPSSTSLTTIKNDLDGYLVGAQTSDGYTTLHINGGTQSMKYANIPAAAQDIASRGIGDGVQIYVYANNSSEITDIVVVEQQLAKVTAVNDKKQTITLALSGDHQGNNESSAIIDSTSSLYGKLTDAKVAVGDYLLVVMNGKTVKTADIPETVTGVVKAYTNRGALTMDGTKYNASISKIDVATEINDLADPREYEDTTSNAVLYLDACGNVVAVKGDIDSKIVYVGRLDGEDGFSSVMNAYVFFADGGKGVYTVASYNGSTDSEDINLVKEGLYLYTLNDKEISLKDMGGGDGTANLNSTVWHITAKPKEGFNQKNDKTMTVNEATTQYTVDNQIIYVDRNTVFFTHKLGAGTTADPHIDSNPEAPSDAVKTDFVNVSTGLKSLQNGSALTNVSVLCKIVDGKKLALAVYGENAGTVAAASNDLVYISDNNWETENSNTYSTDAVFTGEKEAQNLKFKGERQIGLYTYTEKDGVYDVKLATPDNCAYGNRDVNNSVTENGVRLYVAGKNVSFISDGANYSMNIAKDVLVFDEDLNVVNESTLINKDCYGYLVVDNTKDKNVIVIYIAKSYDKDQDPNDPSYAPEVEVEAGGDLADMSVTYANGKTADNLQANEKVTIVIKAAGRSVSTFTKNSFYDVTINDEKIENVKCTTANELRVDYTVKRADLDSGITVQSVEEHEASSEVAVVKPTVSGGNATADVKHEEVAKEIEKAAETNTTPVIDSTTDADTTTKKTTVNMDAGTTAAVEEAKKGVTVVTDQASVTLPAAAVTTAIGDTEDATLKIITEEKAPEDVDTNENEDATTIFESGEDVAVVSIEAKVGDTNVLTGGTNNITVKVAVPKADTKYYVVHVASDGVTVLNDGGTFTSDANAMITLTLDHFSDYAVMEATERNTEIIEGLGDVTPAIKALEIVVKDNVADIAAYLGKTKEEVITDFMWASDETQANSWLEISPYVFVRYERTAGITVEGKPADMTIKCGDNIYTVTSEGGNSSFGTFKDGSDKETYSFRMFNALDESGNVKENMGGVTGVNEGTVKTATKYTFSVTWNYADETKTEQCEYTYTPAKE